jgi:hypothetical protein
VPLGLLCQLQPLTCHFFTQKLVLDIADTIRKLLTFGRIGTELLGTRKHFYSTIRTSVVPSISTVVVFADTAHTRANIQPMNTHPNATLTTAMPHREG